MSEIVDKSLLLNKDIKFRGGMDSSEHVYKTTDIKKVMQMRSIMDELN
ncbi:hypothetical protein J7K93_08255 [bacterium]|nr:hypothetical protein [bacterium]